MTQIQDSLAPLPLSETPKPAAAHPAAGDQRYQRDPVWLRLRLRRGLRRRDHVSQRGAVYLSSANETTPDTVLSPPIADTYSRKTPYWHFAPSEGYSMPFDLAWTAPQTSERAPWQRILTSSGSVRQGTSVPSAITCRIERPDRSSTASSRAHSLTDDVSLSTKYLSHGAVRFCPRTTCTCQAAVGPLWNGCTWPRSAFRRGQVWDRGRRGRWFRARSAR